MISKSLNITILTCITRIPSITIAGITAIADQVRTGSMDTCNYSSIALKEKYIIHVNM
jgi:hypothetical protein